jgi:hypothetical protein
LVAAGVVLGPTQLLTDSYRFGPIGVLVMLVFTVLGLTQTSQSKGEMLDSSDEQSNATGLLPIFVGQPKQLHLDLFR